MFGHGGSSAAPVSKNYPEMRERLRLLLSKKNKCKQQQPPQQLHKIQNETFKQKVPSASSKSSDSSLSTSSVARNPCCNKSQHSGQTKNETINSSVGASKKVGKSTELQIPAQLPTKAVSSANAVKSTLSSNPSTIIPGKYNLSNSSSKSSVVSKEKSVSTHSLQNQTNAEIRSKETSFHEREKENDMNNARNKLSNVAEQNSKIEDVNELLDYIEGNQKAVTNEKKKAKKERQKQQKIEDLRRREEEEKRLKEEKERERRRIEEEKRKQDEEERQKIKKLNKKAAQKAKKLSAKGLPVPMETNTNAPKSMLNLPTQISLAKETDKCVEPDPVQALDDLKVQHLRELQELQLLHRQQLEREHQKLMQKQQQQLPLQRQLPQQPLKPNGKERKKGKNNAKQLRTNIPEANSAGKLSNNVQASAYKTLAEAAKNPGNQIKITRMPNGGVEFSTVPAGIEQGTPLTLPKTAPSMMMGQGPAPPPYLQEMFNRNPMLQPHIPQPLSTQSPQQLSSMANASENSRPCVQSKSNQPMVTIRRVENPSGADPTVTISMKEQDLERGKGKSSINSGSKNQGKDKLLYTLVNGKVLKSDDVSDNLIPHATPMPKNMRQYQQKGNVSTDIHSEVVSNSSFGTNATKSSRPPLPLDSNGKVDLNRLDLPSGISITKIEGQAPERKYFPSKSSEHYDQSILPLPGQHYAQRGMFNNISACKSSDSNSSKRTMYSVDNLGHYNIPGIGPTNPNNVIVVDTSSLADNSDTTKTVTNSSGEKPNKKNKKKAKQTHQQPQSAASLSNTSPMLTKTDQVVSSNTSRQPKPYVQMPFNPTTSSQNVGHTIRENVSSVSSSGSAGGDLKSGPQVLIKNVNGRVVITPVAGTGASLPKPDIKTENGQNYSTDACASSTIRPLTSSDKISNQDVMHTVSSEFYNNAQQNTKTFDPATHEAMQNMKCSDKLQEDQRQHNTIQHTKGITNVNGINPQCFENGIMNSYSQLEKANYDTESIRNVAYKQLGSKLSKSVNDIESVGGKRRLKKSSIGENFDDLSKYHGKYAHFWWSESVIYTPISMF